MGTSMYEGLEQPPDGENAVTCAIQELDSQNTLFFSAVHVWSTDPTDTNQTDMSHSGARAATAFRNAVSTVLTDEWVTSGEERADLLSGLIFTNESSRTNYFNTLFPDKNYSDVTEQEDIKAQILQLFENEMPATDLIAMIIDNHLAGLNADILVLSERVRQAKEAADAQAALEAEMQKSRIQKFWERNQYSIQEFGYRTGSTAIGTAAGIAAGGLLLKKLLDKK